MSPSTEFPTLHFFRVTPANMLNEPPLVSSLQSLETTFFLLALKRYPSALASCATAWESAIKAKLKDGQKFRITLKELVRKIREKYPALKEYDQDGIDLFRQTRNRIVHYGFSPKDDQECARLLVKIGLPFLASLYRELFDFYVNWHDLRPELKDFSQLRKEEMEKAGLFSVFADQLQIVSQMYELNKNRADFNPEFCFTAFSHYIRVRMKESFRSFAEGWASGQAESSGIRFETESAEKKRWEREMNGETWEFDCPVCDGVESVVALLDSDALNEERVSPTRCVCVSCHLAIPEEASHLADLLFKEQIHRQTVQILECCI